MILPSDAILPSDGSEDAVGLNLYANSNYIIQPGQKECISTWIALEWIKNDESDEEPKNFYLRIAPRSGLALKYGINVFGEVCDEGYRGEIKVILFNSGDIPFVN